ncbi:DUF4145 domain-containing protein [Candidatus Woesearchaeota archaeon]|nr:DUF4145 domain-containing protein [Candidatus Woesearchaeota archaeon]
MVAFDTVFGLARRLNSIEYSLLDLNVQCNAILIGTLSYKNKKEEKKEKTELINKIKPKIKELNLKITHFNKIKNKLFTFLNSRDLEYVNFEDIENIIDQHKDDSKIGREHTLLKIHNAEQPLITSISNFFHSFDSMFIPFGGSKRKWRLRNKVYVYFRDIMHIYSFGFLEAATFLCARTLEEVVTDYLKFFKKYKKVKFKLKEIDSWDFDNKINILKKEKLISHSQYTKMLSIKWDRNIYAHPSKKSDHFQLKQDADAMIKITTNMVQFIESKISKLH